MSLLKSLDNLLSKKKVHSKFLVLLVCLGFFGSCLEQNNVISLHSIGNGEGYDGMLAPPDGLYYQYSPNYTCGKGVDSHIDAIDFGPYASINGGTQIGDLCDPTDIPLDSPYAYALSEQLSVIAYKGVVFEKPTPKSDEFGFVALWCPADLDKIEIDLEIFVRAHGPSFQYHNVEIKIQSQVKYGPAVSFPQIREQVVLPFDVFRFVSNRAISYYLQGIFKLTVHKNKPDNDGKFLTSIYAIIDDRVHEIERYCWIGLK